MANATLCFWHNKNNTFSHLHCFFITLSGNRFWNYEFDSNFKISLTPHPPKIGENMIFCIKSWFFTQTPPKFFASLGDSFSMHPLYPEISDPSLITLIHNPLPDPPFPETCRRSWKSHVLISISDFNMAICVEIGTEDANTSGTPALALW